MEIWKLTKELDYKWIKIQGPKIEVKLIKMGTKMNEEYRLK